MPAFISHSFEDAAIYSVLSLALDSAGVERWDPKTMMPGESLAEQLRAAIRRCEVCVFLATNQSMASKWCLAEVGAFWGSGKSVVIFLADPNLTDASLPPQFKGQLMARDAGELIRAVKGATEGHRSEANDDIEFVDNSSKFGDDDGWIKLVHDTSNGLDIKGVALMGWRQTRGFRELLLGKAAAGCKVRILMMHLDNPVLPVIATDYEILKVNIPQNYKVFKAISDETVNVEVRQLPQGLMYCNLTLTDQQAVVIPFFGSQPFGRGPLWKCGRDSGLYQTARAEFETLWKAAAL